MIDVIKNGYATFCDRALCATGAADIDNAATSMGCVRACVRACVVES